MILVPCVTLRERERESSKRLALPTNTEYRKHLQSTQPTVKAQLTVKHWAPSKEQLKSQVT